MLLTYRTCIWHLWQTVGQTQGHSVYCASIALHDEQQRDWNRLISFMMASCCSCNKFTRWQHQSAAMLRLCLLAVTTCGGALPLVGACSMQYKCLGQSLLSVIALFVMCIILAENIPRTIHGVYARARRIFDPRRSAEGWVTTKERNGREEYLYSAILVRNAYSQSDQTWITQFYLQTTPCLPFLHKC